MWSLAAFQGEFFAVVASGHVFLQLWPFYMQVFYFICNFPYLLASFKIYLHAARYTQNPHVSDNLSFVTFFLFLRLME